MAAPTYVDAGTGATDAGGAWTYTCQASGAAGNVFIVQIFQDGNTAAALSVTGASNIEDLGGTDNAWTQIFGNGGSALICGGSTRQHLFIGRALSTSAPTISGDNSTSEDLYIQSYQFQDVNTGTTLATILDDISGISAGSAAQVASSGATISDLGITTLGADRLVCNFIAMNDDVTGFATEFSGETGGDWVLRGSFGSSTGTDGAVVLQTAAMPSAGTINGGSYSVSPAAPGWGIAGFALIGTTVVSTEPARPEKVYLQAVNRSNVW